jgi:fluoride ion exporter CrcB/FEX
MPSAFNWVLSVIGVSDLTLILFDSVQWLHLIPALLVGQQLSVYIFVYRCRRETRSDEKRGYSLRLRIDNDDSSDGEETRSEPQTTSRSNSLPSIRVVATVAFAAVIISLCSIIVLLKQHQQFAISLLFTPFGCLSRWKIQKAYNKRLPGFPLGTFACNILSVALCGSIGSFLAGNPGPEERIVLTSVIGKQANSDMVYLLSGTLNKINCSLPAGFAGSLSTFAGYIAEVLALIDPIIFKFDGIAYAIISVIWGTIIGFFSSQAKNWADLGLGYSEAH